MSDDPRTAQHPLRGIFPASVQSGWENPIYQTGQIGKFPVWTLHELLDGKNLIAGPRTAQQLRSAYDLDVVSSQVIDEGVVVVIDMDKIGKALEPPMVPRQPARYVMPDYPLNRPEDAFRVSGT